MRLDDGSVLSRAAIAYQATPLWFLPLSEFSDAVGFAIRVTPHFGKATGYFLSENRSFFLETSACTAKVEGKAQKYDCKLVIPKGEEIYVDSRLLEKWFPVQFKIDTYRSLIQVIPLEKLPEQLKKEREALLMTTQALSMTQEPGFQKMETPNQLLTQPFLDQQLSFSRQFSPEANSNRFQHTTEMGNEILGFESYGYLLGTEKKIEQWQASLAKRDPEGKILGPFHLTEARFLYLNLPPLPLITEGRAGRGVFFSNYPLNTPSNYGTQNFEGPLPTGWEVELYRNDFLLDRQVSNPSGRYAFRNIPLQYGRNQFRLNFYGPRGERKTQYETFHIDPTLIRPDSHDFRTGFAVLPDEKRRFVLQYEQSLIPNLSLGTGVLHDDNPTKTYAYLGATSFLGPLLLSSNIAGSHEGQAYDLGVRTGYQNVFLGGKYSRFLNGYSSELFESTGSTRLFDLTNANLSYILPFPFSIAMTWDISHRNYIDTNRQTVLKNLLSTNTGAIFWNHEFDWYFNDFSPFRGKLDLSYLPASTLLRLGMEYVKDGINYIESEAIQRINESYSISLLLRRQLKQHFWQARGSALKLFSFTSAGFDFAVNSPDNYSLGMVFSYSLGFDPRNSVPYIQRDFQVPYGAAAILIFKDLNHNLKWDPGEPPLPKIALKLNQRETDFVSGEEGKILLSRLPANIPVDLSLTDRSFSDPFVRPAIKGIRFIPKASSTTPIEMPVMTVGEVDGYVLVEKGNKTKPKRGISIELLTKDDFIVSTTRTDSDGFYVFDAVHPGEYQVKVSPTSNTFRFKKVTPLSKSLRVKEEGSFESHNDFILVE